MSDPQPLIGGEPAVTLERPAANQSGGTVAYTEELVAAE